MNIWYTEIGHVEVNKLENLLHPFVLRVEVDFDGWCARDINVSKLNKEKSCTHLTYEEAIVLFCSQIKETKSNWKCAMVDDIIAHYNTLRQRV